jgi:hypothetical protein
VRLAAFPIFGAALVYLRKLEDRLQLDATEDDVRLAWDVVDRFTPVVEKALVVFGRQG